MPTLLDVVLLFSSLFLLPARSPVRLKRVTWKKRAVAQAEERAAPVSALMMRHACRYAIAGIRCSSFIRLRYAVPRAMPRPMSPRLYARVMPAFVCAPPGSGAQQQAWQRRVGGLLASRRRW